MPMFVTFVTAAVLSACGGGDASEEELSTAAISAAAAAPAEAQGDSSQGLSAAIPFKAKRSIPTPSSGAPDDPNSDATGVGEGSSTADAHFEAPKPVTAAVSTTTAGARITNTIRMTSIAAAPATVPDLSALPTFNAVPPYYVQTKDGAKRVKLGIYGSGDDVMRGNDFVASIINPLTNRTNALTLQTPVQTASGMRFVNVSDTSTPRAFNVIPGRRIDLANNQLTIAYRANDPPSSEKCRVMINSWPVPTRQTLTWDLSFKLGGDNGVDPWPRTKATVSPTLLWQLKADPGYPSMGFFVDTSPESTEKVQLTFFQRTQNTWANEIRWVVPDLPRDTPIDMVIQAVLDDRSDPASAGTLRVWLNGKLIVERIGRNLIQDLPDVHRWAFGVYMMSEANPVPESRVTTWRRARMVTGP